MKRIFSQKTSIRVISVDDDSEIGNPKIQIHIIHERYARKIKRIRRAKKREAYTTRYFPVVFVEIWTATS